MSEHVPCKGASLTEGLAAMLTIVWLLCGVSQLVITKSSPMRKGFVAIITPMSLLSSVGRQMGIQVSF